tara:strand:+ start:105 stop:440 length:336 start_codon:yes stop_codon:yes gene_type:complete
MKYFVEINSSNRVIKKFVADDDATEASMKKIMNTSNSIKEVPGKSRNNADFDSHWNEEKEVFILKQPYPSWTLNDSTNQWEPPVAQPADTDTSIWVWHEDTQEWVDEAPTV